MQALKPKPPIHTSTKQKFNEAPKNDRPTKRPMAGHKDTPVTIQLPKHMGGTEKTVQQKNPQHTSETCEELKEPQIKKLCAEIEFSINNMVSYYIPMETLRAEVEKFKGGNNKLF